MNGEYKPFYQTYGTANYRLIIVGVITVTPTDSLKNHGEVTS